jgi:WD40 repeat protein
MNLMRIRYIKLLISVLLFSFFLQEGYAQTRLELKRQGILQTHVDASTYPRFTAIVRASENGLPVTLTTEQIIVFEDNRSVKPFAISPPDAEGWQKIEWFTSLLSKTNGIGRMLIFATFNNQSVGAIAEYSSSVSIVNILNPAGEFLYEINMGLVLPGESVNKSFQIWPQAERYQNAPIYVDSVTINSPNFRYFDVDGPPFTLISPFTHDADIIYRAQSLDYKRGKMTIHYDGGRRKVIPIIAGNYKIEKTTLLNVVQPNGGEVLTPCQVYEIKWVGSVKGLFTKIEYTTDYGVTWKEIAYVADSSYMWTVPPDISDNVYIRVSQPLQKNNSHTLKEDDIPVTKVAFDSKGDYLLAANRAGMIYQWNLINYSLQSSYSIGPVNFPGEATESKGLLFFDNNTKFVAAYNRFFMYPDNNPDTLAFFNVGTKDPYALVPVDVVVKEIYTDAKRRFIAVLPKFDNKLHIHSFTDGKRIRTVDFEHPIADVNFSTTQDTALVVLYNNDVVLLTLPDFKVFKTISMPDIPQILKAQISPNGKFVGVACLLPKNQEYTGNRNEAHLIELNSGMIIRTSRYSFSNPVSVGFSPTSNIMITGNEGQPQIAFWNLPEDNFSGSIPGNSGILTDMKVSPSGLEVATTSFSDDNLTVKSFTYPESDMSDGTFRIVPADYQTDSVLVQPKYIGMDNIVDVVGKFCNTGLVPIIIDYAEFKSGEHFALRNVIENDTVTAGNCYDFQVIFHPLDTGLIRDTLVLYSCSGEFLIPFEAYSLPRDITFYSDPFDFGELCVGETETKDVLFARNNDPVPLKINLIYIDEGADSDFQILDLPRDTVLPPGGTIELRISFSPTSVGLKDATVLVKHSDLNYYKKKARLVGVGIGTDIQTSHDDLRFIPEIPQRKLTIQNLSNNDITIVEADIYPYNNFTIITPLPQPVKANGSLELEIEWNGIVGQPDTLHLIAEPCVNRTIVLLGAYTAHSYLDIPTVEADPNGEEGDAVINIRYKTNEDHPYQGKRFFESEITINPRMFLPLEITSDYGEGTLIRNEIVNDRRIIGFRVDGDFPAEGVVVNVRGIAGLAETDTSFIRIMPGTTNWGEAVTTTWEDGLFKLINICNDRRIIRPAAGLRELVISPNPTTGDFRVKFESDSEGNGSIEIMNNLGQLLVLVDNISIKAGTNYITINSIDLPAGSYNLIVRKSVEFISKQLIIIK